MSRVQLKVDIDIPILSSFDSVMDDATKREICEVIAEMCDPYVPYRTGKLSKNVTISSEGVTYNQPYAEKNYFGVDIPHNLTIHPLATAKWDEAMMADHGEEFMSRVQDIINRRLQELHG